MHLPRSLALASTVVLLAACSGAAGGAGPSPFGGGSGGASGAGGAVGGTGAGMSGTQATGGSSGSGGAAGQAGSGGGSGAAGGNAGQGGGGGAAGAAIGGSPGFWGPDGPKKQWSCPAGPFGDQMRGQPTNVCVGFKYNYGYNEGPTWIASQNAFFFSNFKQGQPDGGDIIKYTLGGDCEVWLHDVGCNGLGVSPSGNLIGACHGPQAVMEYDVKTKQGRTISSMVNGQGYDSPNDLVAHSNGTIYFSNPTYERGNRPPGIGGAILRIDPTGKTSIIQMGGQPNGVALSPDETKLYVVAGGTWSLDAMGVPGAKTGDGPGGDGLAVDCAGHITADPTNSAYGGPDGKTLFVVHDLTATTIPVSVPGLP